MTEGIIDSIFDQYIHSEKCPCLFCKSFRKMRRELIEEMEKSAIRPLPGMPYIYLDQLIGETKE